MTNIYDIIILGSGIGGLESAYILSKKGYRVCLLEKNEQLGGTLQGFKFRGCHFETGMHYLGSLDEGQNLNKLFKYFNIFDKLHLKRMDDSGFDIFNIEGQEYRYAMGYERFTEQLMQYFPSEKSAIANYVQSIQAVVGENDVYMLRQPVQTSLSTNKYIQLSTDKHIKSLTQHPILQQLLSAQNFIYAGEQNSAPFYVHALINNYFIQSAYKIIGGSDQIARHLGANIRSLGGEIFTKKAATAFMVQNDQIVGVETQDGDRLFGRSFISNIHPGQTLDLLDKRLIRKSYYNRIKSIKNTISSFSIHLKMAENSFPYLNHNYQYFKGKGVWKASSYHESSWPDFYFLTTPPLSPNDHFSPGISVLTYMKFEEVSRWKDSPSDKRGQDYTDWKNRKAEQLIDLVSIQFPDIRKNILGFDVSTPLTYRDYIGTEDGAMYGSLRDYRAPLKSYVSPRTRIPNLFFTGQNINLHGMLGVSLSSLQTCGEFVGLNTLIKEINEV